MYKVNFLRNKISWFGKYSGYEPLTEYFKDKIEMTIVTPSHSFLQKVVGKLFQVVYKWNHTSPLEIFAELVFYKNAKKNDISHILYVEGHVHSFDLIQQRKNNLLVTIHLPISQWSNEKLNSLSKLSNAIILYKEEMNEFKKYMPNGKLWLIKLGVDINFFKFDDTKKVKKNKILFVGHYLRNFEMFLEVYDIIKKNCTDNIEFHFLIPSSFRNTPILNQISQLPNIFFHEGLSDEAMLEMYQTSYLLLLPMNDSGANTAIIQAISTGLPIITTDVGGIRSYGGGEVFELVDNNDSEAMAILFFKYYDNEEFRNEIAVRQRKFAVNELDWEIIAKQHIDLYKNIIDSNN